MIRLFPLNSHPANLYGHIDISSHRRTMKTLSQETVYDLLGTQSIPGTQQELHKLCLRIGELVDMNGENWVIENRDRLLREWTFAVRQGLVKSDS